jgi:hypothetical protein
LCEVWKNTFDLFTAYCDQTHIRSEIRRQPLQNGKLFGPCPVGLCILNHRAPGIQLICSLSSGDQRYLVTSNGESNGEDGTLNAGAEYDNFQLQTSGRCSAADSERPEKIVPDIGQRRR